MLQPKKTKYRKMFKGKMKGTAQRGATLAFGSYGIKSLEEVWMTARQIEAARIAATRYMKREGQLWIRIFPDKPITKKPAETRMGSGKGNPEAWVAVVKPGRVMFELSGVDEELAREHSKRYIDGTGEMNLSITKVDASTGEFAGVFTAVQPSDTDMGSHDPLDVKITGQLYGRLEKA